MGFPRGSPMAGFAFSTGTRPYILRETRIPGKVRDLLILEIGFLAYPILAAAKAQGGE